MTRQQRCKSIKAADFVENAKRDDDFSSKMQRKDEKEFLVITGVNIQELEGLKVELNLPLVLSKTLLWRYMLNVMTVQD